MDVLTTKKLIHIFAASIFAVLSFVVLAPKAHAGILYSPQNNLGLVAYWSFEDGQGTQATDHSGSSYPGVFSGTVSWVDGKRGTGVSLSGSTSRVYIGEVFPGSTSEGTIAGWFNKNATSGILELVQFRNNGSNEIEITEFNGAGGLEVRLIYRAGGTASQVLTDSLDQNTWTFLALTWSKTADQVKAYRDGAQIGSTQTGLGTFSGDPWANGIGNNSDTDSVFDGKIDEVRLYNRALSATEIADIYNNTKISHVNAPTNTDLVAYWGFEDGEGTEATDQSGNGYDGTLNGDTAWVDGKFGKAVEFDASGSFIEAPAQDFGGPVTIAFWVYRDPYGGERMVLGQLGSIDFREQSSTQIRFFTPDLSDTVLIMVGINENVWTHVAFTYDSGTGQKIGYINGSATVTESSITGEIDSGTSNFQIGARGDGNQVFDGKVDEFRIYDRALSAAEIAALYNSKAARINASTVGRGVTSGLVGHWTFDGQDLDTTTSTDRSGNGNDGTLNGDASPYYGKLGQAIKLDGTGDYIQIADDNVFDTTTNFSASFWVNVQSVSFHDLLTKGQYFTTGDAWAVEYQTDNALNFSIEQDRAQDNISLYDSWNHIVVTFDSTLGSNNMKMYINNVLEAQQTRTSAMPTTADPVTIGANDIGGGDSDAYIDDVRIYNKTLTTAEIQALYKLGAP